MSFQAIRENKILTKISGFTVYRTKTSLSRWKLDVTAFPHSFITKIESIHWSAILYEHFYTSQNQIILQCMIEGGSIE